MTPPITDTLCTQCGLCCDGSLFADVELAGADESAGLEAMGLEIEEDDAEGAVLVQPCAALRGRRCSIYAHRPKCCRTFECGLLQRVRRGALSVARAAAVIAEARERLAHVRALAARKCPPAELEAAQSNLKAWLAKWFLSGAGIERGRVKG